jgi:DNA-binding GntR family transcriptional regulator
VVFQTSRNIQIPVLTEARYLEIRAIRTRLEAFTAETAAEVATRDDIGRLEAILNRNEAALKSASYLECTELNQVFHFELTTIARQPVLQGILRRLWLQMGPLIAQVYVRGGRIMIDQHYAIVDAIRQGNGQRAAEAMVDDILLGGEVMLPFLGQEPQNNAPSAKFNVDV